MSRVGLLALETSSMLGSTSVTSGTLLNDRQLHTLATRKRDKRVVGLAEHEHVRQTSGEGVAHRVLDVDNLEGTSVLLTVHDDTDTASVTTASGHAKVADLKVDVVLDLASGKVQLDGVVHIDLRIRVADGAAVVSHKVGDTTVGHGQLGHTAQLELGLLRSDAVDNKAALLVVKDAEVLASLLQSDDIHEASGVARVSANAAINLHETLQGDVHHLTAGQSVLKTVAQKDDERKALTQLVGASAGADRVCTTELIKHPVLGSCDALQMLLRTTNHLCLLSQEQKKHQQKIITKNKQKKKTKEKRKIIKDKKIIINQIIYITTKTNLP